MNLKQATELIAFENPELSPQFWLDLGCGSGLFTIALTRYLTAGSTILAVDKDVKALKQIAASANGVAIETMLADFSYDALKLKEVDGILMANSLHYVKEKERFLKRLVSLFKGNPLFLIVEYDRTNANSWVPYPLSIDAAKDLFKSVGCPGFTVLNTRPSVYGEYMYAAMIR
jgi:ubiquinone/menaquinone biosynthesis C-methylase UbiE